MASKVKTSEKSLQVQTPSSSWNFFICGLFLSILFVLSDNLIQNIILLPLVSFISYLLIKKLLVIPCIITFLLTAIIIFKDAVSASFDNTLGYFFYIIVFFFLSFLGCLCGSFVKWVTLDFKHLSACRKCTAILTWTLTLILSSGMLYLADSLSGNPFISCYAQIKMKDYLEKNYSYTTANLTRNHYQSKGSYYTSKARLYTDSAAQVFNIYYKKGRIWDDYFSSYLEDLPAEYRLAHEASEEIKHLLTSSDISFSSVDCSVQVKKDQYTHMSFNRFTFKEPLTIRVYKLTDTKESYSDFTDWCESVRFLLAGNSYLIQELTLESDPHFMANRLSLTLGEEQLSEAIADASALENFIDYGKLNDFNEELTAEELGCTKVDFYYDETLSAHLTSLIHSAGFCNAYAKASVNADLEMELDIFWSGQRISIDSFAENILEILTALKETDLFNTYTLLPLNFQYSWGTAEESYYYTLYEEQLNETSLPVIVQTLLNEDSFK